MAGLVFLADFFDWTAAEAAEAYIFRSDIRYALNTEPGVKVCSRTVERYQKLFRDHELAARVFHDVTTRLADELERDIARQRLDSTHVFSHMASFGRTKLMAVAITLRIRSVKLLAALATSASGHLGVAMSSGRAELSLWSAIPHPPPRGMPRAGSPGRRQTSYRT